MVKFRATLRLHGKTATGIEVPPDIVAALGSTSGRSTSGRSSKRPPVVVTIAGHSYRSSVASMGGSYLVGVSAENRAAAGVAAGDELEVELQLDTEPREIEVPEDLAAALAGNEPARARFEGLSYSAKRGLVDPIRQAKTAETRQRRIDKALTGLTS